MARPVLAALVLLALGGCGSAGSSAPPAATLQADLISVPPAGFSPNGASTGPMDAPTASYSTPADVGQTTSVLQAQHYQGGYVKVWQKGPDYVTAAIYRFDTAQHAIAFADFEKASITGELGSYTYALSQPSWGTGFVITSHNKTRTKVVFCQGGLFYLETDAFLVQTCGEQPNSSTTAEALTNAQYLQASGVVFGSIKGPSPSPGKP